MSHLFDLPFDAVTGTTALDRAAGITAVAPVEKTAAGTPGLFTRLKAYRAAQAALAAEAAAKQAASVARARDARTEELAKNRVATRHDVTLRRIARAVENLIKEERDLTASPSGAELDRYNDAVTALATQLRQVIETEDLTFAKQVLEKTFTALNRTSDSVVVVGKTAGEVLREGGETITGAKIDGVWQQLRAQVSSTVLPKIKEELGRDLATRPAKAIETAQRTLAVLVERELITPAQKNEIMASIAQDAKAALTAFAGRPGVTDEEVVAVAESIGLPKETADEILYDAAVARLRELEHVSTLRDAKNEAMRVLEREFKALTELEKQTVKLEIPGRIGIELEKLSEEDKLKAIAQHIGQLSSMKDRAIKTAHAPTRASIEAQIEAQKEKIKAAFAIYNSAVATFGAASLAAGSPAEDAASVQRRKILPMVEARIAAKRKPVTIAVPAPVVAQQSLVRRYAPRVAKVAGLTAVLAATYFIANPEERAAIYSGVVNGAGYVATKLGFSSFFSGEKERTIAALAPAVVSGVVSREPSITLPGDWVIVG